MTSRFANPPLVRRSVLVAMVFLGLLTCTGASIPGNEGRDSTAKVDTIRDLEQKTLSLAPPLVQATVGLGILRGMGAGSGVIVSEDGLILTAGHVVPAPGEEMIVFFSDGKRVKAKALGADKQIDAGLAQITEKGKYPFVKMGKSSALKKGDWVMAIGNPGGYRPDRKPPIRLGRVLNLPNRDGGLPWIQTDATVAPGDSGGPLFNMDGEVVGIHSNISPNTEENRHVAIDDYTSRWDFLMASKVRGRMFSNGNSSRPQLGLHPEDQGGQVRIRKIEKESQAEKAGFHVGDIILKIDGRDVNRADDVFNRLRSKRTGNEVTMLVVREGEEKEIKAKLGEGPRTYENPHPDLLPFLEKYGFQRPDGVWEYQQTEKDKPEFDKVMEGIAEKQRKVRRSGELNVSKDDTKSSPKLLEALSSLAQPSSKSIAVIYNENDKVEGEFEEKPSVLGTVISPDGFILTKASELKKKFYCTIAGKEYECKLIGKREDFDLALLKLETKDKSGKLNVQPVKWASQSDPSPGAILFSPTVDGKKGNITTLGIVSNAVREIGSSLSANKAVMGVQFSLESEEPLLEMVTKNGPADKAGIKVGDLILSVNGTKAVTREKIQGMLKPMKPGDKITIEVKRKEQTLKFDVTLGSRSETFANLANGGRGNRGDFQQLMFDRAAKVSKRNEDFPEALTHDSPLGNTQMGGPVLNLSGQAIGLNIARFDRTGSYAITYKTLQPIIEKLLEEGKK